MTKINLARVLAGGLLLAGVVINVGEFILNGPILGEEFRAAMEALDLAPIGGGAIAVFVLMGFALGIAAVWIYAAIRPRFGPGPKTALCAGLIVWALAYLFPTVGMMPFDMFPVRLLGIAVIWGLFELPIATLAGASVYKEE